MPKKGTNIFKRKDGRWEARYVKEVSADGSKKYDSVYGKSFSEAKEKQELCIRNNHFYQRTKSNLILCAIMYEWLEYTRNSIKKSTYQKYESIIRNHITGSILGKTNISYIRANSISEFSGLLLKEGKLAAKSINDILIVIGLALTYAEEKYGIVKPKILYIREAKREMRVLSLDEQRILEQYLYSDLNNYKMGILFALYIVIPDGVPAIVPKDLFDRVQERLEINKKAPARKKAEEEYLLTTKLYCGKCQSFMVGESGRSKTHNRQYRYYKCVSVKYHKGCDKKTVKKDWLEDLTIDMIKRIIFNDKMLDNLADEIIKYLGQESTLLPQLRKQLKDCEKGIDNLLNAIQAGIFTTSTKERLESLEQQKEELTIRIAQEEINKPPIDKDKIMFWLHRFRKLDTTKLEHRKRLIDSFVNAIYLYDDKIIFTFNYKDGSKTVTMEEIENSALSSDLTSLGAPGLAQKWNEPALIFSSI